MSTSTVRPLPIPAPITGGLWFHNHARNALRNALHAARHASPAAPQQARTTRPAPKGAVLHPGPFEDVLEYLMRGGGELENY